MGAILTHSAADERKKHLMLQSALEDVVKDRVFKPELLSMEPDYGDPKEYRVHLVMRVQFLVTTEAPEYAKWVAAIIENMVRRGNVHVEELYMEEYSIFWQRVWLMICHARNTYHFGPFAECYMTMVAGNVLGEKNNDLRNAMLYMLCKALLECHTCKLRAYNLLEECIVLAAKDARIVNYLFIYHKDLLKMLDSDINNDNEEIKTEALKCVSKIIQTAPNITNFKERSSFFNVPKYAKVPHRKSF